MSALWLLPLAAIVLVVIGVVASRRPSEPAEEPGTVGGPEPRRGARQRRLRLQAWTVDLVVGACVGVPLAYGLGQSALATGSLETDGLDSVTFAVGGAVLGIAFMRVIRRPRAAEADSSESPPTRDPDYDD